MRGGHRFLARSLRSLAGTVALGRVAAFRDGGRSDPAADDHLGAIRGEPRTLRGPRASTLYTEWFPPAREDAPTLVFTHGLCLTEAVWHYQKRDLAGAPFGLVTWDLPGHGHSEHVAAGELTQELAIDALARVVEEYAGPAGVVVIGHSLGGSVALGYLARHAEAARARVLGGVAVSSPMVHLAHAVAGTWAGAGIEARVLGRVLRYLVESDMVDRRLSREVGSDASSLSSRIVRVGFGKDASPAQIRYMRDVIASVPPQVRADAYRAMTSYDIRGELDRIRHPVLVVLGDHDRLVSPEESRALARELADARLLELPDAGHAAFLEKPNAFNHGIAGFAERLGREPSGADSGPAR